MDPAAEELLEKRRLSATRGLGRQHRAAFGQFFTPAPVARYMASLFAPPPAGGPIRLLDPGAGIGSLTAAVVARLTAAAPGLPIAVTCYEIEPRFQSDLQQTLSDLGAATATVEARDFVAHSAQLRSAGEPPRYTHAVLNPPYRKIRQDSPHRLLTRELGLEATNLYACFLACAVSSCVPGAEVVAIVPRSFMNGPYFKSFRRWLLARVAVSAIHVFDRRDRAFADDAVLQENVILRLIVGGRQSAVTVSSSPEPRCAALPCRRIRFADMVRPDDPERVFHIPDQQAPHRGGLRGLPLRSLGLDVRTGPVVDFRLREHLRDQLVPHSVPLLYASHFVKGRLQWPQQGRRANAIACNAQTERWLMPRGCYVVLRRLTSKEEKRRVVAYLLEDGALPGGMLGFENHLNVIHQGRRGLPLALARGLVRYLNSQAVDAYFRTFSGHTQVNAADLRRLRYPDVQELTRLGQERGTD